MRGNHVQQRRLARARRPHQREEFALRDVDRNVVERRHLKRVALENLADVARLHNFGSGRDLRAVVIVLIGLSLNLDFVAVFQIVRRGC